VLRDHAVTAVTSAKAALALLEEGQSFDVVFCDLMMPQMSGMDFFVQLQAK
jgi:CheY-like chemotaxis protein